MNSTRLVNPTAEDLSNLAVRRSGDVVSLLLPPLPVPEARLTLRNLVKSAASSLEARGHKATTVRDMLAPVDAMFDDHERWNGRTASYAIYIDAEGADVLPGPSYGLPRAIVGSQFHIVHLLAAGRDRRYAVLVVGKKSAHLYRSAGGALHEVETQGLPVLMEEVLRFDDREPHLQSHSSARSGAGRVVAAFHGQGGRKDQSEDDLRYLRVVAAAVDGALDGEPLVLAATEENAAAFNRIADYAAVLDDSIAGNAERLTPHELAELAGPILSEAETAAIERVVQSVADAVGTERAALDVADVIGAAVDGRVASLVLAGDAQALGTYDAEERRIDLDGAGEDLLNLAAIETWRHRGGVVVVPSVEAPGNRRATALLRY